MWRLLKELGRDEDGAAMAEYVVLLGLIVGALVLVITNFTHRTAKQIHGGLRRSGRLLLKA